MIRVPYCDRGWSEILPGLFMGGHDYNRSGLLVAFILLRFGLTPEAAIERIRDQRSPYALRNEHFVELIHKESADVAA